jgi:hypothetical protein
MDNFTIEKILLLCIFFVPGFIYMKVYRLFIAERKTDFSKDLYEAIGISLINVIFYYLLIYLFDLEICIIIALLFLIIVPIFEVWIFYKISKTNWYLKRLLTPNKSPWDDIFSKKESYWVIVTLKSGRKIAGKYAAKSYASEYPSLKEIYLEEVYGLKNDNSFGEKVYKTSGILITEGEISTIEFFVN